MAKSRSKTKIRFESTQDDTAQLAAIQRVLIETNNALDSIESVLVEFANTAIKGDLKGLEKAVEEVAYSIHQLGYDLGKDFGAADGAVSELKEISENLDGIVNFVGQSNLTLKDIKSELIEARRLQEVSLRRSEEDRIESIDEKASQLNALGRIEEILKRGFGAGPRGTRNESGGVLSSMGGLTVGAVGILVSLFKSLPKLGEMLKPLGGILGAAGGLLGRGLMGGIGLMVKLFRFLPKLGEMLKPLGRFLVGAGGTAGSGILSIFKRFLLPINAIFALFEGISAFFDTSGIAEKLGKDGDSVSIIDRLANGLAGFVSKFIGNIIDPIFKFFGIEFSLENFISGGLVGAQKFISDSVESMSAGTFLKDFATSVTSVWSGLVSGVIDTLSTIANTIADAMVDLGDAVIYWAKNQDWMPEPIRNTLPETKREKQAAEQLEYQRKLAKKREAERGIEGARGEVERIEFQIRTELDTANKITDESQRAAKIQEILSIRDPEYTRAKERVSQLEQDLNIDVMDPQTIGTDVSGMMQVQTPNALMRAGDMTISDQGFQFIKDREGFRADAYQDVAGVWTIGYGTTRINGEPVQPGMTITEAQASELARDDVKQFERAVNKNIKVGMTQNEFDAMVSFAYNVGGGAFAESTMVRKMNAGDRSGAASEFQRWNKAGGKEVHGLSVRRDMEAQMFAGASDYSKLSGSSVRSSAPTNTAGSSLVANQQTQAATAQQIASAPIQAQIINNNQTQADEIKVALRNDEPSFKKVIERMALSSLGVLSSPIMSA